MTDSPDPADKWDENGPSIMFDLWLLQQALTPLIETAISSTRLSADEYGFYLLMTHIQDATPGDIARMTGMRANTTSAALTRLEKRGHLVRTPNEEDKRSVRVRLSPEGLALVQQAVESNAAIHDRLMGAIEGTEIARSVSELERIVRELANMPPRPDVVRAR
jgi:DNA-binding MarR family transcriptional regulator